MSRIFLSHSWTNNAQVCALRDWLAEHGWDDVFLDLDPRRGLVAGERWQEALKAAADRCEAVIFLVSPAWTKSRWCLVEFLLAKNLGKQIFGVLVEEVELSELPGEMVGEFQLTRLVGPEPWDILTTLTPGKAEPVEVRFTKDGLERLRIGLEKAGLDARSFKLDRSRPLYPGLRALDTQDAAIFFGRDADIVRGMDRIRQLRDGGKGILVVLGASGAGKSSFVRAGLWPRIERADREFLALPVVRPESAALEGPHGLLACLATAGSGMKKNLAHWRKTLAAADGLSMALHELFAARAAAKGSRPLPVLVVDQAEELFHADAGAEGVRLLERLREALQRKALLVLFSIRSDAYERLQAAPQLKGIEQELYSLPPLARGAVKEVIEGPARRQQEELGANALKIDPQLTERLLRDWSGTDALPLLAFSLERLVHDYGGDGRLDLAEYEASGGLSGAIEAAVAKAVLGAVAAGEISRSPKEQESLLRQAFVPWLVRVEPETRLAERKRARFDRLPAAARPLVERWINAGLLTSDLRQVEGAEARVVEIAHEALLRQWPLLARLVEERREELSALEQVRRDAVSWAAAGRHEDALLHRGGRLSHADALLLRDDLQSELGEEGRDYLRACRQRENQAAKEEEERQERERQQLKKARRAQQRLWVLFAALAVLILATGLGLLRFARVTSQGRSDLLAALAANAFETGQYDRAIRFALSGMAGRDEFLLGFDSSLPELELARASQRSPLRLRLVGHEGPVSGAKFSPDGSRLLTASQDHTARIWDASSGRELTKFVGHEGPVRSAVFSPDGARVLTASEDGTARIWDVVTGKELVTLQPHKGHVWSAAFDPDGKRVVTAHRDGVARVWDVATSRELTQFRVERGGVRSALFSSDGSRILTSGFFHGLQSWSLVTGQELAKFEERLLRNLVVSSSDGSRVLTASKYFDGPIFAYKDPRIWDAATGLKVATLQGMDLVLLNAAFSQDARLLVAADKNGAASIWDSASGKQVAMLEGQQKGFEEASFSLDGSRVVTASWNHAVQIWDTATGQLLGRFEGHDERVSDAEFSPDGTRVVTAFWDQIPRIWDAEPARQIAKFQGHSGQHSSASFDRSGTRLLMVLADQPLQIWDVVSGMDLTKLWSHGIKAQQASLSPEGTRLVTVTPDGTVRLLDSVSGQELATIVDQQGWAARFSEDSRLILIPSKDETVGLWSAASGQKLTNLEGTVASGYPQFFPLSADGRRVLTIAEDNPRTSLLTIRVWDVATSREIFKVKAPSIVSVTPSLSRSGRFLSASDPDGSLVVLDTDTGRELTKLQGLTFDVLSIRFNHDETCLLAAGSDGSARVWNLATGQEIASFAGHEGYIYKAEFNSDGTRVITAGEDGTTRIWDAASGKELAKLEGHTDRVWSAAFVDDGSRVVTISKDKTARIWDTRFAAALRGQDLIDATCREVLSVDIESQPFEGELSRLSSEELRLAPVLNPAIDGDACRPATAWQRVRAMFGLL